MFNPGDSVINTKTHNAADIITVIPAGHNSIRTLYIIEENTTGYLIVDETDLVVYDKYYWDDIDTVTIKEN
jgi:hypothetical protein